MKVNDTDMYAIVEVSLHIRNMWCKVKSKFTDRMVHTYGAKVNQYYKPNKFRNKKSTACSCSGFTYTVTPLP